MKSFIAALRSLVLPYGAISGARIVLDGVNGSIQVYSAANVLIGVIDGNGLTITGSAQRVTIDQNGELFVRPLPNTGSFVALTTSLTFGGVIFLEPENSTIGGVTFTPGTIYADNIDTGGVSARPYVKILSPYVNPALHTSQILLHGQASDSAINDAFIEYESPRGVFWTDYNVDSGRGWVNGAGLTVSSGAIAAAETTVLALPAFTYKKNRAYLIKLTGMVNASVAGKAPLIRYRKTNPAGTQIDVCRVSCPTVATYDSAFESYMTVGAADVNAVIAVTLQADATFTSQLTAGAGSPASCNIFDVGDAANFAYATSI